jgi:hypothetical protein
MFKQHKPTLCDVDQTESIHQSLADKKLLTSEHLVDAGYVDGTLLVESKQQHDIELIGPVRDNVSWRSQKTLMLTILVDSKLIGRPNNLLVLKELRVTKSGVLIKTNGIILSSR